MPPKETPTTPTDLAEAKKKMKAKLRHLGWAIDSRAKNQRNALRLLKLLREYEEQWKTKRWAKAAQDLISISFSLWRAAFLADKSPSRSAVFAGGVAFLERVIEDNAISYTQDRNSKDWTFNYYTGSARAWLLTLHENWQDQVPKFESARDRTPTERWEYCQELLEHAVEGFETLALNRLSEDGAAGERREKRAETKNRRRKIRLKVRQLVE